MNKWGVGLTLLLASASVLAKDCGAVIISAWWEPLDKLSENRLGEGFERNLMILH